ncbi:hypothetical protein HPB47_011814 [Ixodes persulcatus]|uniref:Uncharacterized protein n=1 Tax=Ixodes persulcatus TaxID=34615 RepID=A0AC60NV85_IXOPE|nr:hypothetical protein HPB47_011814 [Ixodes persulcatus]
MPHNRATAHAQKAFHSAADKDGSAQKAIFAKAYRRGSELEIFAYRITLVCTLCRRLYVDEAAEGPRSGRSGAPLLGGAGEEDSASDCSFKNPAEKPSLTMAVNVPGVVSLVIFYVVILAVGIWAGRKSKKTGSGGSCRRGYARRPEHRHFPTWVGGGYINGTAEVLYTSGIIWCQAPFGYALSLVIG